MVVTMNIMMSGKRGIVVWQIVQNYKTSHPIILKYIYIGQCKLYQ
jgi:hypothetical protein